jgi:energy-coupling factor transporter ATP-binding protein EcfA2
VVQIDDVSFKYKGQSAFSLSHISLTIHQGDFLGVIGAAGAGKTTFSHLLTGVIPHHFDGDFYGKVEIDGKDTVEESMTSISKTVGMVFEDIDAQMVSSTVEDEMRFALENRYTDENEIETRVHRALNHIGIADLLPRTLHSLSGGQKQKVAIAAIIALEPKMLILDEPTGQLDPKSSLQVFEVLKKLNESGTTIIVTEQKLELISAFANRILALGNGSVQMDCDIRSAIQDTQTLDAIGVGTTSIVKIYERLVADGLYAGKVPINADEAESMLREAFRC